VDLAVWNAQVCVDWWVLVNSKDLVLNWVTLVEMDGGGLQRLQRSIGQFNEPRRQQNVLCILAITSWKMER
jgi:hypothetical protein